MHEYIEAISDNPVIAAVQSKKALEHVLTLQVPTIFLLNTDIFSAKEYVAMAKASSRNVFLHMDLIEGLAGNTKALDYIKNRILPNGIISTKSAIVKYARKMGIFCIQRFFMIDSVSYDNAVKTVKDTKPSMVELMPGIIPEVIRRFKQETETPVIAGGLVTQRRQVIEALSAGAIGVSTGCHRLWTE